MFDMKTYKWLRLFVDNLYSFASDFEKLLYQLETTFQLLQAAGLTLKLKKCVFFQEEIQFLDTKYLEIKSGELIKKYPKQTTKKALQRWLRLCNWKSKFIPNYYKLVDSIY